MLISWSWVFLFLLKIKQTFYVNCDTYKGTREKSKKFIEDEMNHLILLHIGLIRGVTRTYYGTLLERFSIDQIYIE